ncbi:protein kinase domain-containing protein [Streptomyces blattellae]|uniref:serine/threonine-protein kinase n=1 Tax=Streptomyces blattellae TaxID=2569855 RepID=UPI0012B9E5AD|nr:serine/threonine-protein kinase [Streptomyces blattellae]
MPLHRDDPRSVGGYKLVDRLGAGGMGVVYWGRSRSGRDVAVKVVHAQYAEDRVFRARFRQEIEAVRKVSGAFTAPVVDADPEAARPWMATQYVPGSSLAQRIRDHGALRGTELRRLALGLVEALRDIHRAGVVHRDLKPANVLMAEDGPRVIDFGISRAVENHATLTETGQMIGTPPFMSPEQFTDARKVGPESDIFSLGALLVYAVTGRGPFDADSPYLTAYRVVHDQPVLDGVVGPLRTVLERCLAKETADRPELDDLAYQFAQALPEQAAVDPDTMSLRLTEPPPTPDTGIGPAGPGPAATAGPGPAATAGPGPAATAGPGRRRGRTRPLLAATGTIGAAVLGLTAYLLLGPGWADSGGEATLPSGWKPWQTTVFETAASGVKKAPAADGNQNGPDCEVVESAVYCVGDGVLPVRLDRLTGDTVWRADAVPIGDESASYSITLLGVRDGAMLIQQTSFSEADENDTTVTALDVTTGERLWRRPIKEDYADVILSGDLVVMPDDTRSVTARSPRTGAVRWTARLPADHYCAFTEAGADLYLQCAAENDLRKLLLLRLDRADGSARRLTVPDTAGALVGAFDGRLLLLEPTANEEGDLLVGEDAPYARIRLVDPVTGASSTTKLAEEYAGQVTLANGTLWFATSSGQVIAVSPRTGKPLWQTPTSLEQPGAVTFDPRARTVYLASNSGRVAALDAGKGTLLWDILPRAERVTDSFTGPEVFLQGGALVVATPDGTVFTLDPAHPDRTPVPG